MTYTIPSYALHFDDEAEIRDTYWNPQRGDRVIDIGARYGSYTLPALAAGATVTAIDYNAQMLGLLKAAADANGFEVRTICTFLYDGTPYPEQLSAQIAEPCPPEGVGWSMLDDITDGPVDWIKVDVEGAELGVLRGGLRTLEQHHPNLIVEDHTRVYPWVRDNHIAERIENLLGGLGYSIESVPYEAPSGSPRDFTICVA